VFGLTRVDGQALNGPLPADEAIRRFEAVEPPAFVKRRTRWIAAVAAVAILATVGIVAISRSGEPAAGAPSPPITVLAVDPTTNSIDHILRDGIQSEHRPGSIGYDGTNLWQATSGSAISPGLLVQRDAQTGEIVDTHEVNTGDAIGFGYGYAWAALVDEGELDKIDPVSGEVVAKISLPGTFVDADGSQRDIWYVSKEGDLVEIDPLTAKITNSYHIDAGDPSRVVPLLGDVWGATARTGRSSASTPHRERSRQPSISNRRATSSASTRATGTRCG
jgi:hypothetical protein